MKGRDWYDMEWYIRKKVSLNLNHFLIRANYSGDWDKGSISEQEFRDLLNQRIDIVNFDIAKDDVKRFLADSDAISIWS